ncbi:hypothetical protein MHUMG1_05916 [Metarhizium humberi]|uniref:Uncharacterized protein n=1 Tax=Metarhizium humberi TaxID=2596975 RepID=A0A9P8S6P5_9HYPO|nr:hypothetical protein MHUMG1_05916 [Metarhizium humberi]
MAHGSSKIIKRAVAFLVVLLSAASLSSQVDVASQHASVTSQGDLGVCDENCAQQPFTLAVGPPGPSRPTVLAEAPSQGGQDAQDAWDAHDGQNSKRHQNGQCDNIDYNGDNDREHNSGKGQDHSKDHHRHKGGNGKGGWHGRKGIQVLPSLRTITLPYYTNPWPWKARTTRWSTHHPECEGCMGTVYCYQPSSVPYITITIVETRPPPAVETHGPECRACKGTITIYEIEFAHRTRNIILLRTMSQLHHIRHRNRVAGRGMSLLNAAP